MNCTRLQELAAAYALGALDRPEAMRLEALAASDPDIRDELNSFLRVTEVLLQSVTPVAPPASVRDQVLARIRGTPRPVGSPPPPPAPEPVPLCRPGESFDGFRFLRPAEGAWTEGPVPGSRIQVLSANWRRNYLLLFFELDPGTVYPQHVHGGPEELYLLRGDLVTEGRRMQPGDFIHCEPGTQHRDVVSPSGCQALLLTPLTSAVGEVARASLQRAADSAKRLLGWRP